MRKISTAYFYKNFLFYKQKLTKVRNDFTKILIDFKTIPQHKRTKTFMEIAGYPHYENVCSNILSFYLDPKKEHGLKDLVLSSLLDEIDNDFRFDIDFEVIEVHREYQTLNGNRLDLVLLTENFAIGIENKIFHHLHNDLEDYKKTIQSLCNNIRKPICIVLSLSKLTSTEDLIKIKSNNFINITYEQLFKNIKKKIGHYLNTSKISYTNHFSDFIKSIENLTPKTMENKILWMFFQKNANAIQELLESFNEYKNFLFKKVYQLNDTIAKDEFAPSADKKWIYKEQTLLVLVFDYTIDSKYKLAVDTTIKTDGWEILIFGRNFQSSEYIFNTMFKDNDFLPQPYESYEKDNKLIYCKLEIDTDISIVAKTLTDILFRIENYIKRIKEKNDSE